VIRERDSGQADAINKGLARATGDIISWLCADDELAPGALDHVASIFDSDPQAEVVIGACERIFADGSRYTTVVPPDAWLKIGRINVIDQPSVFWRRSLQEKLGPLDTSYRLAFDWDLWCRMARARANLHVTNQVLSRYYFSAENKTSTAGSGHARESFRVIRKHGPLRGWAAYIYRFLYQNFDLHGCYDQPPTCTFVRGGMFVLSLQILRALFGDELIYGYNWHFASCQERGLKWW
jgi:glycosyltransferase involved in cell wall biosynthesis